MSTAWCRPTSSTSGRAKASRTGLSLFTASETRVRCSGSTCWMRPSEQAAEVFDALDLGDAGELRLDDPEMTPAVEQQEGYLHVTAVAVSEAGRDSARERVVVDCLVGPNWAMTAHKADIAALDAFRRISPV